MLKTVQTSDPTPSVKPPHINLSADAKKTKEEMFQHYYEKCIFRQNDPVVFKKPKRNKVRGVVDHIETDVSKMFWTDGGLIPRYIRVSVPVIDKVTGEILRVNHVWTSANKLVWGAN